MNAHKIIETAIQDGGGTFDPASGDAIHPRSGFAVGAVSGTLIRVSVENPDVAADALKIVVRKFPAAWLGLWVNEGEIHIDPVVWIPTFDTAIDLGKKNNQKAIWSFADGQEVAI